MARPKTPAVPKETHWSPIKDFEAAYAACLGAAAHYSSKTVNSNAAAVGIRLAADDRYNADYVAVSTIGPEKVPVDYVRGANPDAKLLKQAMSILRPSPRNRLIGTPPAEAQAIEALGACLAQRAEVGVGSVDARLRQVLMPTCDTPQDGEYVALTPLNAAGLSALVNERIEEEIERAQAAGQPPCYRARTRMGFGGSNPQNVGRLVREMQRPLVFEAPALDPEMRRVYALFYKGLDLARSQRSLLDAYALWRHALLTTHGGRMPSTLDTRAEEADYLQQLGHAILREAAAAYALLQAHVALLGEELSSPRLDATMRALLNPRLRTRDFVADFARLVVDLLARHSYRLPGAPNAFIVAFGDDEAARLLSIVEAIAR